MSAHPSPPAPAALPWRRAARVAQMFDDGAASQAGPRTHQTMAAWRMFAELAIDATPVWPRGWWRVMKCAAWAGECDSPLGYWLAHPLRAVRLLAAVARWTRAAAAAPSDSGQPWVVFFEFGGYGRSRRLVEGLLSEFPSARTAHAALAVLPEPAARLALSLTDSSGEAYFIDRRTIARRIEATAPPSPLTLRAAAAFLDGALPEEALRLAELCLADGQTVPTHAKGCGMAAAPDRTPPTARPGGRC